MRMTIDEARFFEIENRAIANNVSVEKFKEAIGEAVYRCAINLNELRDENDTIAIDGAICSDVEDAINQAGE
jgi:hypothetical protein